MKALAGFFTVAVLAAALQGQSVAARMREALARGSGTAAETLAALARAEGPKRGENLHEAIEACRSAGRGDLALSVLTRESTERPSDAVVHYHLGFLAFESRRLALARAEIKLTRALDPDSLQIPVLLGRIEAFDFNYDLAARYFQDGRDEASAAYARGLSASLARASFRQYACLAVLLGGMGMTVYVLRRRRSVP